MFIIDDDSGHPVKRAFATRDIADIDRALAVPPKVCRAYARDLAWQSVLMGMAPAGLQTPIYRLANTYTDRCWRVIRECLNREAATLGIDPGAVVDHYVREVQPDVEALIKRAVKDIKAGGGDPWLCVRRLAHGSTPVDS